MIPFTEDIVERAALNWLDGLGYGVRFGGDIAPGEPAAERESYDEVLLLGRLRAALLPKLILGEIRVETLEEGSSG